METPRVLVERISSTCVHYGFCTAVCPTYVLTGDENDSPRGRIALAKRMVAEGKAPDPQAVHHLDRCLSCLACTTTCGARVDYAHLIDGARVYIEQNFKRPIGDRLLRFFLAFVLPRPALLRIALAAAACVRPFSALIPGRLKALLLAAPRLPERPDNEVFANDQAELIKRRVAYHSSCVQRVVAPHIDAAAIRYLRRHGCEVVELRSSCCGALTLHMGKAETACESASNLIEEFWKQHTAAGFDALVVSASGCGTTVKDYSRLLQSTNVDPEKAKAVSALALDISEIIPPEELQRSSEPIELRIAYHDACSIAHGQKITAQPRKLLKKLGVEVADVPESHFCCGSAGVYNLLQPEIADQLGARKAKNIEKTFPQVVVTSNLGCIHQIGRYLKDDLKIVHTAEFLDWATGGPRPKAIENVEFEAKATAATQISGVSDQNNKIEKVEEAIW